MAGEPQDGARGRQALTEVDRVAGVVLLTGGAREGDSELGERPQNQSGAVETRRPGIAPDVGATILGGSGLKEIRARVSGGCGVCANKVDGSQNSHCGNTDCEGGKDAPTRHPRLHNRHRSIPCSLTLFIQ